MLQGWRDTAPGERGGNIDDGVGPPSALQLLRNARYLALRKLSLIIVVKRHPMLVCYLISDQLDSASVEPS
jgi:hypothetical protein